MSHGATDDATQNVSTILIRWEDSVVHQHGGRAGMLGKNPQTETCTIVVVGGLVRTSGQRLRLFDERKQHVAFPHRVFALHEGEDAFKAGTCVD